MMKVVVENDYDGVSKKVAGILIQEIKSNPNIILGLATGSTTKGMYLELINSYKTEGVDFSGVRR